MSDFSEVVKRDWIGLLVTAVTFGLFSASIFLIVQNHYVIDSTNIELHAVREELNRNREEILHNRAMIEKFVNERSK